MTRFGSRTLGAFICFFIHSLPVWAEVHHSVQAELDPPTHRLSVTDQVSLGTLLCDPGVSGPAAGVEIRMTLHAGLTPSVDPAQGARLSFENRETVDPLHSLDVEHYRLHLPCGLNSVLFRFQGTIDHPIIEGENPYSRGTADSPGMISSEGIVLSGGTYWFPQFPEVGDRLVSFELQAHVPAGWSVVSQGEPLDSGGWRESHPQDDFYLIAAPFTRYERQEGGLRLQAFLRTADPALATRYLDATSGYLNRYSKLIGPYPYAKFALVENFWDTGFGMPSFTLLGSDIIRLPFIINTSYPHEILHDWWGNGVFVDFERGNWSEGITAYMADHLMAERGGAGEAYRRDTLQKYTDFVNPRNDFPLNHFLVRTDAPTEAIGYGKALMFFHMLRVELGDEVFRKAFSTFYLKNEFHRVSYSEIQAAFEAVRGQNLASRFAQWVERTGAPSLKIVAARVESISEREGFQIQARVEQVQGEEPWDLLVPVAIHLEGQEQAFQKIYPMKGRVLEISEIFATRPVWLEVDPEFDVFRRLSRDEVPPVVTMALGAARSVMVLPSAASPEILAGWRQFADLIRSALPHSGAGTADLEIVLDSELESGAKKIEPDRAVWVLGKENHWVSRFAATLADQPVQFRSQELEIAGISYPFANHSTILLGRTPAPEGQLWVFAATDAVGTFSVLANKLVHYGKYGYLVFESEKVTNTAKGIWKLQASSMSRLVEQSDGHVLDSKKGKLLPRVPLAD